MLPRLTEVFKIGDADGAEAPGADPFDTRDRRDIESLKPNDVEKNETVHQFSHAFGAIERGINEAKNTIEHVPDIDHEVSYESLDELADHAYELWRHLIYGEEMVRWKRNH